MIEFLESTVIVPFAQYFPIDKTRAVRQVFQHKRMRISPVTSASRLNEIQGRINVRTTYRMFFRHSLMMKPVYSVKIVEKFNGKIYVSKRNNTNAKQDRENLANLVINLLPMSVHSISIILHKFSSFREENREIMLSF